MKRIVAFYDAIIFSVVCLPLITLSVVLFFVGNGFTDSAWNFDHWYVGIIFSFGIAIPVGAIPCIRFCLINTVGDNATFSYGFSEIKAWSWKSYTHKAKELDIQWNTRMLLSEIAGVKIVKLSKDEKKCVSTRFLFNKYLKIEMKYGAVKYVYVANYANWQIERIMKLLTRQSN